MLVVTKVLAPQIAILNSSAYVVPSSFDGPESMSRDYLFGI